MLMMCWFYCVPFAKGLFFASSLLLLLFSVFALKRGVRQSRQTLREVAFFLMFTAFLKIFTVDAYMLKESLLCGIGVSSSACTAKGFKIFQMASLVALALCSLGLLNIYRRFIGNREQIEFTPEQVNLEFWANISISLVVVLILWLAAPWAGYLTVGHVPKFFMDVPWQHLALLEIFFLLTGFWKLEDCRWIYDPAKKSKKSHLNRTWTPKDTLWLSVILFLITLAFSYASNDVLSVVTPSKGGHLLFRTEDIDFGRFGKGFRLP
ncbi:MAG: hypothetical protein V1721_06395 [Pseudomonadota bacterium]